MHCCEKYKDVEDFGYEHCPFCGMKCYKVSIEGYSDLLRIPMFLKHRPVEEWTEEEWFAHIAYQLNKKRESEEFCPSSSEDTADDILKKLEKENQRVEEKLNNIFEDARLELMDIETAKEKWKPKRKVKPTVLTEKALQQLNEEWQQFIKEKKRNVSDDVFSLLSSMTFTHVDFFGASNLYHQLVFELHEITFTVNEKEYVFHSMFYPPDMPQWFEFSGEDERFQEIFGVNLDSKEGRKIKYRVFDDFHFQNRIEDIAPSNPELKQKYGQGWIF